MNLTVRERDPPIVTLRLDELEKTPLAGAGNFLYRVPLGEGYAVVKIYFGSRSRLLHLKKTATNLILSGRSAHTPRGRCRTERECMAAWEKHGFRCFKVLDHVRIEGLPRDGYMVNEYLPGLHFRDYFRDDAIPLEERMSTWRRWLPEWHRRHKIAVETGDSRLIHENGDVKHVMLVDGDFVYFDFEVMFTSKNVCDLVGREILAYMRSTGKFFGKLIYRRMMDDLVAHYPDRSLLQAAWDHAYRNPSLLARGARVLDRGLRRTRHGKRYSKYAVARELKARLDAYVSHSIAPPGRK